MPLIIPSQRAALSKVPFDPLSLFKNGEIGSFLLPADLEGVSAQRGYLGNGITAVAVTVGNAAGVNAVVGAPVGILIDRSVIGLNTRPLDAAGANSDNLVGRGSFATTTNLTIGADWTVDTGTGTATKAVGSTTNAITLTSVSGIAGVPQMIKLSLRNHTNGTLAVNIGSTTTANLQDNGDYILYGYSATATQIACSGNAACDGTVSAITAQSLPGNHARSATDIARPTMMEDDFGRRYVHFTTGQKLSLTLPSSLGTNCTVAYRQHGIGVTILKGQTVSGTYDLPTVDLSWVVVVNRPTTASEDAYLRGYDPLKITHPFEYVSQKYSAPKADGKTSCRIAPPDMYRPTIWDLEYKNNLSLSFGPGDHWIKAPTLAAMTTPVTLDFTNQGVNWFWDRGGEINCPLFGDPDTGLMDDGVTYGVGSICGISGQTDGTFDLKLMQGMNGSSLSAPILTGLAWNISDSDLKSAINTYFAGSSDFKNNPTACLAVVNQTSPDNPGGPWLFVPSPYQTLGAVTISATHPVTGSPTKTSTSTVMEIVAASQITIKNWLGMGFIQGLYSNGLTANDACEVFNANPNAVLFGSNCRFRNDFARYHPNDFLHSDAFQTGMGPAGLIFWHTTFTGRQHCQLLSPFDITGLPTTGALYNTLHVGCTFIAIKSTDLDYVWNDTGIGLYFEQLGTNWQHFGDSTDPNYVARIDGITGDNIASDADSFYINFGDNFQTDCWITKALPPTEYAALDSGVVGLAAINPGFNPDNLYSLPSRRSP